MARRNAQLGLFNGSRRAKRSRRRFSAAQLASQRRFAAMARARAKSKKHKTRRRSAVVSTSTTRAPSRAHRSTTMARSSRRRGRRSRPVSRSRRRYSAAPRAHRKSGRRRGFKLGKLGGLVPSGLVAGTIGVVGGYTLNNAVMTRLPQSIAGTPGKRLLASLLTAVATYAVGKRVLGPKTATAAAVGVATGGALAYFGPQLDKLSTPAAVQAQRAAGAQQAAALMATGQRALAGYSIEEGVNGYAMDEGVSGYDGLDSSMQGLGADDDAINGYDD